MTNYELIAALVTTAIGSGGLTGFWASRRNSKRDDFDKIKPTWQADNDRLRQQLIEVERKQAEFEIKLQFEVNKNMELQNKLVLLESAHHDLPFPQWLKDNNGVMLSLNKAYEDMFLIPMGKRAQDYIGHTDEDIWGEEIAAKFRENDKKAKAQRGYWIGTEPINLEGSDISKQWKIIKYIRHVGRVPVGVAGIAIPVDNT